ncbi:hypothetical protein ACW2Q0_20140 [Nocardia sp. R16R-3T]
MTGQSADWGKKADQTMRPLAHRHYGVVRPAPDAHGQLIFRRPALAGSDTAVCGYSGYSMPQ